MQALVAACAEIGDLDGARAIYDEMKARSLREYCPPMKLAISASCCGNAVAVIGHARDALRTRDPQLCILSLSWGQAKGLRAIPRFREILSAIGPPGWNEPTA